MNKKNVFDTRNQTQHLALAKQALATELYIWLLMNRIVQTEVKHGHKRD